MMVPCSKNGCSIRPWGLASTTSESLYATLLSNPWYRLLGMRLAETLRMSNRGQPRPPDPAHVEDEAFIAGRVASVPWRSNAGVNETFERLPWVGEHSSATAPS